MAEKLFFEGKEVVGRKKPHFDRSSPNSRELNVEELTLEDGRTLYRCTEPGCGWTADHPRQYFAHSKRHVLRVPDSVKDLTLAELVGAYDKLRGMGGFQQGEPVGLPEQIAAIQQEHREQVAELKRAHRQDLKKVKQEAKQEANQRLRASNESLRKENKELLAFKKDFDRLLGRVRVPEVEGGA